QCTAVGDGNRSASRGGDARDVDAVAGTRAPDLPASILNCDASGRRRRLDAVERSREVRQVSLILDRDRTDGTSRRLYTRAARSTERARVRDRYVAEPGARTKNTVDPSGDAGRVGDIEISILARR